MFFRNKIKFFRNIFFSVLLAGLLLFFPFKNFTQSRQAEAVGGLPYQFGGSVITYYQPFCTLSNITGTCEATCPKCSAVLAQACNAYQEIQFTPAPGSQGPDFICVPKGFPFNGGVPRMGGQILGGGASNVMVWVAGVSR